MARIALRMTRTIGIIIGGSLVIIFAGLFLILSIQQPDGNSSTGVIPNPPTRTVPFSEQIVGTYNLISFTWLAGFPAGYNVDSGTLIVEQNGNAEWELELSLIGGDAGGNFGDGSVTCVGNIFLPSPFLEYRTGGNINNLATNPDLIASSLRAWCGGYNGVPFDHFSLFIERGSSNLEMKNGRGIFLWNQR